MTAQIPPNEAVRLDALRRYAILDTLPEQAYDDITRLAAEICDTPIAIVTLVDAERQWFKAKIGIEDTETPRSQSFCAHAILEPEELFIVSEALDDARFADYGSVTGNPHIRFYAGAPLVTEDGAALGSLCVIDRQPRVLTENQKESLRALSRQVMAQFELRRKISEVERSEERYRLLFEQNQGFICVHDLNGVILSANPAACDALRYKINDLVDRNLREIVNPKYSAEFDEYLQRVRRNKTDEGLMFIVTRKGEERVWKYRNLLREERGAPPYVIGYAQDITELLLAQERLRTLSLTDDLTGLNNRRGFLTLAAQTLKVARRKKHECLLMYADLDGLKAVNDSIGHDAGSRLIVDAGQVLKTVFRESDIIARLGGDEFAVLVTDVSAAETEELKIRLQTQIAEFNRAANRPYQLSISIGTAHFASDADTPIEEIMKQADARMYADKKSKSRAAESKPKIYVG